MSGLAKRVAAATDAPESGGTVADLVASLEPQLRSALPQHIKVDRFLRLALTELRVKPALTTCDPRSLLGSVMKAGQLGLEIDSRGLAYLVPYGKECTLIIGYQGMIELARRDGRVTSVYAYPVREADEFSYQLGLHPDLSHVPAVGDRGSLSFVYAVAHLRDADPVFVVLDKAEVDRFRNRSKAANSGPWATDYEAMACKTAVRRLATWLPQSPELAEAAQADEQGLRWDGRQVSVIEAEDDKAIDTSASDAPAPEPSDDPERPFTEEAP